jgi:hypothetical protein
MARITSQTKGDPFEWPSTPSPAGDFINLEGKMKNGKSACFTTDYTDFDGFHGEISLFSNELTAHPAG